MADNKKYYYLKLKDNFFDTDEMIVLESMPDGHLYSNILLKLYLLADFDTRTTMSISKNKIDLIEFISIKTRTNISLLLKLIKVFKDIGFILNISEHKIILKNLYICDKRNRSTKEYKVWRKKVFFRDNFTCQKCNKRGLKLNAHHIKEWSIFKELRFDISNGITLCEYCHKKTHSKGNNNVN